MPAPAAQVRESGGSSPFGATVHLAVSGAGQSPNTTLGSSRADFSHLSYGKRLYCSAVETHLITGNYLGPSGFEQQGKRNVF